MPQDKMARSWKQLCLLCLPDSWNLPDTALLSRLQGFREAGELTKTVFSKCSLLNFFSNFDIYIYWSKANIWNINYARATAYIFDTRTDVLVKCQSLWNRKCLDLRGTRTPNLRIHAECSHHLSYQGQTFAVPCFFNTGSGGIDIFKVKLTLKNVNCVRATVFMTNDY